MKNKYMWLMKCSLILLLTLCLWGCQIENGPAPEPENNTAAAGEVSGTEKGDSNESIITPGEYTTTGAVSENEANTENAEFAEPEEFMLEIREDVLYIIYPDGTPDPSVEFYVVELLGLGVAIQTGDTAVDLKPYEYGDQNFYDVEVTASNASGCVLMQNMILYDLTAPGNQRSFPPASPVISIITYEDYAELTIEPAASATGYEIFINGNPVSQTSQTTYTIQPQSVEVGLNEVYVCAFNDIGHSAPSNTVTTGKLADPVYHSTGTGVEVIWGDVENAAGYKIYGDDGAYLTTIGLSGSYDFSHLYTTDGFYFPSIQAYAEGWMSSGKCGIPINGGHGN